MFIPCLFNEYQTDVGLFMAVVMDGFSSDIVGVNNNEHKCLLIFVNIN